MKLDRRALLAGAGALVASPFVLSRHGAAQAPIVLHGASQFNDDHSFNKMMNRFGELVKTYYGKPIDFIMHNNGELGTEREYMNMMARGTSVDFAVIAPGNMTNFSKAAPLMDLPFLFKDRQHWLKVTSSDAMKPIADEVEKRADVKVIGYGGGGERNIVSRKKATNLAELKGLKMRVQGAPIHARVFSALGVSPSVIAWNEIYNAIQSGVVDALENEVTGFVQIKAQEVAPEIIMTKHSITIRPLLFSGKAFRKHPADLQAAIVKAGIEAAKYGRDFEIEQDSSMLQQLAKEGRLRMHEFADRAKLFELVAQIKAEYAKEIEATDVLKNVDAMA